MAQPTTITVPTQTFTAAELLALTEYRLASLLAGSQEYASMSQTVRHVVYKDLCEQRDKLKAEIEAATAGEAGGGIVLVQFAEPR